MEKETTVEVNLNLLMKTLKGIFIGVAEVFDALGVPVDEAGEMEVEEDARATEEAVKAAGEAAETQSGAASGSKSKGRKTAAESAEKHSGKPVKAKKVAADTVSESAPEASAEPHPEAPEASVTAPEEQAKQESDEQPEPQEHAAEPAAQADKPVTLDDVTKVIVTKITQDRSNNMKIGAILKNYGVAKVSALPEDKYSQFLAEISKI